ncbi:MAG: CDP-glucose 4,6-dehydratase [candidate division WS2 bacterium]|uniref:CDP-glucose 4,6-dehydratase n=1 Tax=Psychracetigena formicireducens TaxID=2986056 RepID=A0A9E2F1G9_PSYF1|nr:CDP-glucose 4,6-dehydratase [Candidatus Psychracetigena formicireducens]
MSGLFDNIYSGKRVLITGHTGFKGSWLSIWLHELGANVIGYALEPPTIPSLFEICGLDKRITSITGDIRDIRTLRGVFKKYQPEIIFHMAAQSLVRYSYKAPVETYETNIMGTVNLLEACRHTPSVRVIVNITSDKCYENREWVWGYREIDPMGGYDPYSSSKGCAELVTNAYLTSFFNPDSYKGHSVSLASVRAGNVIGGGDWGEDRLIPDCIKALLENRQIIVRYPDAVRPWQHVLEPLFGYLLLAQHLYQDGPAFSGAWNFGPDDEDVKPVRWIVEYVTKMWGNNASWKLDTGKHPHEAHYLKLECSKAKSKLGWHPKWNLKVGLEKTIEWYKAYCNHQDMLNITINQIKSYENIFR